MFPAVFWIFLWLPMLARAEGIWSWVNEDLRELELRRERIETRLKTLPQFPQPRIHERAGFHGGLASTLESVRWVQVDLGAERELEAVVVIPAMLGGIEAYGFPRRFRVDASRDGLFEESLTLFDHTKEDAPPLFAPWYIEARAVKARYVRFTATQLVSQPGFHSKPMFALGELLVFSGGRNVALGCRVEAAKAVETLPTWSPRHLVDGTHPLGLPILPEVTQTNGWHSAISHAPDAVKWVQIDLGAKRPVDEIRLIPAHPQDYPDRVGFGFPRRFKVEADDRVLLDQTGTDFVNPGDTPVAVPTPGLLTRTLRVTATRLWERSSDYVFALAELEAFHGAENIARGAAVTFLDETRTRLWRPEHLVDGFTSEGSLVAERDWLAQLSERRVLTAEWERISGESVRALEVVRRRAAGLAGTLVLGGIAAGAWFLLRAKKARQREVELLRQQISRDLHDEIGSHLGSIRLMSEMALREEDGGESLQEIHRLAGEAAESMRGIIWLVSEGDSPGLLSLAEAIRRSAATPLKGVSWELHVDRMEEAEAATTAPLEFHRQVFLIFREAVHNIARHARASRVTIRLGWRARRFHLCIEDDGSGFDPDSVAGGYGLVNLRHRAQSLGGSLEIQSTPAKGTRITLESPLR